MVITQSRPASPASGHPHPHQPYRLLPTPPEPTAILVEPGTASIQDASTAQRPTHAQNMAFAALQLSQDIHTNTVYADMLNRRH